MEKDFHFAVTYVVARLAGFHHKESEIIATSAQYVDDTVNDGTVRFKTGQQYHRISSSHEKYNPKIALSSAERQIWVPFHFLPSGEENLTRFKNKFFNAIVCRPNSTVAQEMLRVCIAQKNVPFALHRLGITAHTFVDTWAHQGFAGIKHPINRARKIKLHNSEAPINPLVHLDRTIKTQGLSAYFSRVLYLLLSKCLNLFFPMGHGAVFHYPDWPFLKWSYVNGQGALVERDNPEDFMTAAEELFKFFVSYRASGSKEAEALFPEKDKKLIREMLSGIQDKEPERRCQIWVDAIARGDFSFGAAKITYFTKGLKSWKCQALGTDQITDHFWERFEYSSDFLVSNWKYFHDALQAHQNQMLHEILPKFKICVS